MKPASCWVQRVYCAIMAEWLFEDGIGERRAALVADGRIVRAMVERDDDGPPVGSVMAARLGARDAVRRRAAARLPGGEEAWLSPVPPGLTEGAALTVRLVRQALREPGRVKPAQVQPADGPAALGPDLHARITATDLPVRTVSAQVTPDALEGAGWGELLDSARTGHWPFPGGALVLSLTPAMLVIDVDGDLAPAMLAEAGAVAAARAIVALGLAGAIGIDFPTLASRAERHQVDARLGEALADVAHERTAINGFGFVQIVIRRERPSLIERMQCDAVGSDAVALLRAAERAVGAGPLTLTARPVVIDHLTAHGAWLEQLARRTGRAVTLVADAAAKGTGHAQ